MSESAVKVAAAGSYHGCLSADAVSDNERDAADPGTCPRDGPERGLLSALIGHLLDARRIVGGGFFLSQNLVLSIQRFPVKVVRAS